MTPEFAVACPRLTELTVAFRYKYYGEDTKTGTLVDPIGGTHSAMSELVVACKALPDFNTLQIVREIIPPVSLVCRCEWGGCGSRIGSSQEQEEILRKQTEDIKDWTMNCLKKPETGFQEGEERERKRITLRVFMFCAGRPCHSSGEVEEYEV